MKAVVAMDSLKGSLSSLQAGEAVREGILRVYKDADVQVRPLADGGEGTVEALTVGLGGKLQTVSVTGPLGGKVNAQYGILADGLTAIPVTLNATQSFTIPAGGFQVYVKGEPESPFLNGDVNGDGEVSIADVNVVIDILLGFVSSEPYEGRADVNNDKEISIADVNVLIDILLGFI